LKSEAHESLKFNIMMCFRKSYACA